MTSKASKKKDLDEALGQLVLHRDWNCIHGVSMQAPCAMCLEKVRFEIETRHLAVLEGDDAIEN